MANSVSHDLLESSMLYETMNKLNTKREDISTSSQIMDMSAGQTLGTQQ